MLPGPRDRGTRLRLVVVLGCVVASLVLVAVLLSTPTEWTSRSVTLTANITGGPPSCYFVNTSVNHDRFCLLLYPGAPGYRLNGTFDHGLGSPSVPFAFVQGPPCVSGCPTDVTWTSPDGTGQIYWAFTTEVTLRAHN